MSTSTREGSLDAPTRHPLGQNEPGFYDENALFAELERVYDICHGCRRCVSLCNAFPTLFDLYKPIIAAINGHANGGGLEQALACDIRVAAEHAQFGFGEVRLGWLPGGGGTQRLPRIIPLGRALELLYTGARISAEEAYRLGLVDHLVPMNQLMSKCEEIAEEICKSAPLAVQHIKQASLRGLDVPLEEGLKLERALYSELQATEDAREGALAFAEKRAPNWQGK